MLIESSSDQKPAQNPVMQETLTALLEQERICRQESRMEKSIELLEEITELLWRAKDFRLLMKTTKTLTSKRGQPVKAISTMVRMCMGYISSIEDEQMRMEFVETMKEVCEKKIYLEVEYARCCMMIVKHKEKQGASREDILEAAKIMENVQVETYGSMDKFEKLEFILYQMKLNILLKDYTKLIIVSKKVNLKFFKDADFAKLEVTFYLYKLQYHLIKDEYAEIAECLCKVNGALGKLETEEEDKEEGGLKIQEEKPTDKDYDPFVREIGEMFLDKGTACQSYIAMMLLEDFSVDKLARVKTEWEKQQVTLGTNFGLKTLVQAFLTSEISSCNLEDYNLKDIFMFDVYGIYANKYHVQLEKQLIKKNLHSGRRNISLIKSVIILQQHSFFETKCITEKLYWEDRRQPVRVDLH
jgi:26S proteasome regulatory subunit N5